MQDPQATLEAIRIKVAGTFKFQDPRMPSYLLEDNKSLLKMDSPVYRICLEAVCQTRQVRSFLEIGVKRGGGLERVLATSQNLNRVVLCDLWSISPKKSEEKLVVLALLNKYSSRHPGLDVRFLDGSSAVVLPNLPGDFDLIGIDGCHRRDVFGKDLRQALRLINLQGVIVIDDLVLHEDHKIDQELIRFLREETESVRLAYRNITNWPGAAIVERSPQILGIRNAIAAAIHEGVSVEAFMRALPELPSPAEVVSFASKCIVEQDWQALDYLIAIMASSSSHDYIDISIKILKRQSFEVDNKRLVELLERCGVSKSAIAQKTGLSRVINGLSWTATSAQQSVVSLL